MSNSKQKQRLSEKDLSQWNLIDEFSRRLDKIQAKHQPSRSEVDPRRQLNCNEYFSLYLFGLLNPVVDSMQGLSQCSELKRVQDDICHRRVSLGSFSEAQSIFDPGLLEEVFNELWQEAGPAIKDKRFDKLSKLDKEVCAIDGSLLPALPRMAWALWQDEEHTAAKLHLKYSIPRACPCGVLITEGNGNEREVAKKLRNKKQLDCGDRAYGQDYGDLSEAIEQGFSFVVRVRNDADYEVLEEYKLSQEDIEAGVVSDRLVRLGNKKNENKPMRLVIVEVPGHRILIVTDQAQAKVEACLIALIYKFRWQVELFFKWLKCILKCRHWFAESEKGVVIQIYLALIAALLLTRMIGKRPTKRQMEMIQFYLMGYASLEELIRQLKIEKKA